MRAAVLCALAVAACRYRAPAERRNPFELRTPDFIWTVDRDARSVAFLVHGSEQLARPTQIASIRVGATEYPATALAPTSAGFDLTFAGTDTDVEISVTPRGRSLVVEVLSTRGTPFDELRFLDIPLTPDGSLPASTLALTPQAHVDEVPLAMSRLSAACLARIGCTGARVAVIAAPASEIVTVAKTVLQEDPGMPYSLAGGPWAAEVPRNHASYLFDFGGLTPGTVDGWIAKARHAGAALIDEHGGASFRFGDLVLDHDRWPGGWPEVAKLIARLHAGGIGSILHTYAFLIDPRSSYVTPVPSSGLDAVRTFTLDADLAANETTLATDVAAGTVLQIGDELVRAGERTGARVAIERGAYGTHVAGHLHGSLVRVLKMQFGLFVPDVASPLFLEIARRHAEVIDTVGFDGVYLDALDGASVLRGSDEAWYWSALFIAEIQTHLKRSVSIDMSGLDHHYWRFRSRAPAWDAPRRGYERFIDEHLRSLSPGTHLPLQLGWWSFHAYAPPQTERTFDEEAAYLGAKMLAFDASTAIVDGADDPATDALRAVLALRLSERSKAILRTPGQEVALDRRGVLHRAVRAQHVGPDPWTTTNELPRQVPHIRIEALAGVAAGGGIDLLPTTSAKPRAASGVTVSSYHHELTVHRGDPRTSGRWAWVESTYEPGLDLTHHEALGLAVEGDGRGELLAVRMESAPGRAILDRYVRIDFTGWRRIDLVEAESTRWSDARWEDGHSTSNAYRDEVDLAAVSRVSIGMADLQPGETRIGLRTLDALPLLEAPLVSPTLTIGARTMTFPVTIPAGGYLDFEGHGDALVHDRTGAVVGRVMPAGTVELVPGENRVGLATSGAARARVTLIALGDALD